MGAKPIKFLELHYTMTQFLIMTDIIALICTSESKCTIFGLSRPWQAAKMAIFELSSISKKLKRFKTLEWYSQKQLTIEVSCENMKKSEISRLSSHSRYLQELALKYE